MLRRLHKAVAARADDMFAAMVEEYGAPSPFATPSGNDRFLRIAVVHCVCVSAVSRLALSGSAPPRPDPLSALA